MRKSNITCEKCPFITPENNWECNNECENHNIPFQVIKERKLMVLAMELLARHVNDEDLYYGLWATNGVADNEIPYMTTDINYVDDYYILDEPFEELCTTFTNLMAYTRKSGGLFKPE